jgi:hypothetical protein
MECKYCLNKFKTESSLGYHIKNAKYCIETRSEKQNLTYKCSKCNKILTSKQRKTYHENICNSRLVEDENNIENLLLKQRLEDKENIIKELRKQLEEKDKQIERLATVAITTPNVITNNNNNLTNNQNRINQNRINQVVNNLIPITDEHLKEQTQFLTLEHIKNGVDGYVQYALDYPLKDRIACTDYSRRKIKYKDEEGSVVDDPEMTKLCQKLFQAINERNSKLIDEYIKELNERFNMTINQPNNELTEHECENNIIEGDKLIDELFKVKSQKKEIIETAKGVKTEIYHDFIKDICLKTV